MLVCRRARINSLLLSLIDAAWQHRSTSRPSEVGFLLIHLTGLTRIINELSWQKI